MSDASSASGLDQRVYCDLPQLLAMQRSAQAIKLDARYRPSGLLAGRHRSRLRGQGMDFEELRGWRSGDNIRDIDWKASAHSRQQLVRVFTQETDRPTVLLVDQRRSLFFGSRERTKSVTAAQVAAMLAWMVVNSGDRLGGIVFNNETKNSLRPSRAKRSSMRLLQAICEYNQQLRPGSNSLEDPVTLDSVLARSASYLNNNGTLILVTDGDGLEEDRLSHLEYLANQFNVLLFLIVDPLEESIAGVSQLVVSDGRSQMQLSADHQAQARFSEQHRSQLQAIRDRIAMHGLPFGVIDTVAPVDRQMQTVFGLC